MDHVAVFDIGKTNLKLSVASRAGAILETVSVANAPQPGPPYAHPDLAAQETWLLDHLAAFARRWPIGAIIPCAHGLAGVLVDDAGPVMPMIDYEQPIPPAIARRYRDLADLYAERGSPILLGAAHLAQQLVWLEEAWPDAVARARFLLPLAQYWAWRLSGVAATELTQLGAQSHLWDVRAGRWTSLVARRGWARLMPPLRPAWARLGGLRPEIAGRTGLAPDTAVLCGIHDSSANFYRYQAAGLRDLAVISTGTWIVGLSGRFDAATLREDRGMTVNSDVEGHTLAGVLTMGGREFAAVAGDAARGPPAEARTVARVIETGTMALPAFGPDDALFPGRAGAGRIVGEGAGDAPGRRALAVIYAALLTDLCLDLLGGEGLAVLDGSSLADPLYAALIAALRPGQRIATNAEPYGTAAGAALLADHATRITAAAVTLRDPAPFAHPGLAAYRAHWRRQVVQS